MRIGQEKAKGGPPLLVCREGVASSPTPSLFSPTQLLIFPSQGGRLGLPPPPPSPPHRPIPVPPTPATGEGALLRSASPLNLLVFVFHPSTMMVVEEGAGKEMAWPSAGGRAGCCQRERRPSLLLGERCHFFQALYFVEDDEINLLQVCGRRERTNPTLLDFSGLLQIYAYVLFCFHLMW